MPSPDKGEGLGGTRTAQLQIIGLVSAFPYFRHTEDAPTFTTGTPS